MQSTILTYTKYIYYCLPVQRVHYTIWRVPRKTNSQTRFNYVLAHIYSFKYTYVWLNVLVYMYYHIIQFVEWL